MKPETFFDNFEMLAEAPNGVKKLREMILELAVRGKLVAQDEKDEPMIIPLEELKAENEKKIKKSETLPPINPSEIGFMIPAQWNVEYLGNIVHTITKGATPTTYGFQFQSEGIRFVKVENVKKGRILRENITEFISPEAHEAQSRSKLESDDILFSIAGTIGETCIVLKEDLPANTNQALAIIRGTKTVFRPDFLKLQLDSFVANAIKSRARGGAMNNISLGDLKEMIVFIPPLAEQHRIVTKVDQLMSLCDELEARQQKKRETRAHLNSAALDRMLAARAPWEFAEGWRRISDNFDLLYNAPENVGALRKAILQLAVMGKLVAQEDRDEPASVLLEKIKAEKDKQIKEKKFKKNKPMPSIEIDGWYELPKGWLWSRIGEVFLTSSGSTPNRSKLDYFINGTENWVKTTDLNNGTVLSCEEKITIQAVEDCNLKYYPIGTVCIAMYGGGGTIGKSGILGIETTINQSVFGIYPNIHINPEFFHFYIKSIRAKWMMFAAGLRRDPNINGGIIDRMIFPLPPLNEQNRIVSKLSDLMSLCDALEAGLRRSQADSERLMEAVVGKMLAGGDSA